jgi:hypothetical protein
MNRPKTFAHSNQSNFIDDDFFRMVSLANFNNRSKRNHHQILRFLYPYCYFREKIFLIILSLWSQRKNFSYKCYLELKFAAFNMTWENQVVKIVVPIVFLDGSRAAYKSVRCKLYHFCITERVRKHCTA